MEISSEDTPELTVTDPDMRRLLGLFDVPAFARRGQELEFLISRLHAQLTTERSSMLDMVRLRLRQWASVATPGCTATDMISGNLSEVVATVAPDPSNWSPEPGPKRKRIKVARDLVASVERFNRRWTAFIDKLNLDSLNARIDDYNRYYLLEKECVFGSTRLAARGFRPVPRLTAQGLLDDHPLLPTLSLY